MNENNLESYFQDVVSGVKGFAIFMLDTEGIIQTWNDGCQLMKGYTADEAIGHNFRMLFPDFLRDKNLPEEERRLAEETGRYETENWRRKKNGDLFWAFIVLTKITDDDGKFIGFVKITQDQTDKKKYLDELNAKVEDVKIMNQQLDFVNAELIRSNASLQEFAYASSHDLKAPLRKVEYFINRIKHKLAPHLNQQEHALFARIDNSIKRMVNLIEDLLIFSFFSRGIGDLALVDLNEQLHHVLDDLELDILQKGAKITMEPLPTVRGNSRQFQQLFQNIISNTLKYTQVNQVPEIHIFSSEVTGHQVNEKLPDDMAYKHYHFLQVKDNGIGFEQAFAEHIFKTFTRLHGDAEYPGSGVGLSIVAKVVQNHHGFIWAESQPGQGATFKILLPAE